MDLLMNLNSGEKQLFSWYGDINPNNERENEIDKFKWLVKQNDE